MGSDFSKQLCCVTCGRCKEQEVEEANEETSEKKPILQTSGEASICAHTRPSSLALEVSKQVSREVQSLIRVLRPSPAAAEENMETGSAGDAMGVTEGWVAAWDSMDFSVAPADGETKGEGEDLAQVDNHQEREKAGNKEEKIKPVPLVAEAQPATHVAWDVQPVADTEWRGEQAAAGGEGSTFAGVTLQERNIPNFMEFTSETAAGPDPEIKPPGESLVGQDLLLCAVQMLEETETNLSPEHVEGMERAKLGQVSPRSAVGTEPTSLAETPALLTVQATQQAGETEDPLEAAANGMAETYSACAVPWQSLCIERETLELTNQLLDFLEQEIQCSMPAAQEMEGPRCAEPVELSEGLCQSTDGMPELEDMECDGETGASEAEPQHRTVQQTEELPEEPLTCVQIPVSQGDEFLNVAPTVSEVPGSSGEIEAENVEA